MLLQSECPALMGRQEGRIVSRNIWGVFVELNMLYNVKIQMGVDRLSS